MSATNAGLAVPPPLPKTEIRRRVTIDIDLVVRPELDATLRAIPTLEERLEVNVELASREQFIPVPEGWEVRTPIIKRVGRVTFYRYHFVAQEPVKTPRAVGSVSSMTPAHT